MQPNQVLPSLSPFKINRVEQHALSKFYIVYILYSWRAQTKPCAHHKPGERSSDPTRDQPRLAHECPGVSGRGMGWRRPPAGLGALRATVHALHCGPFEWGRHYLHYLHHSLASGQTTGREHSPTHRQKIGLKIYWAWTHQNKTQFPLKSVSPTRKLP